MPFLSQKASSAVAGGTGGGYLNPSKIQSGSSVRFALLSDQPLEFFECWGEAEDGSVKPFRLRKTPATLTSRKRWATLTAAVSTARAPHPRA